MISLTPLYKIPSSHVMSSLKYQYDCILWGQSLIVLCHPSWTILANSFNAGSLDVASHVSLVFLGLLVQSVWCDVLESFLCYSVWCHSLVTLVLVVLLSGVHLLCFLAPEIFYVNIILCQSEQQSLQSWTWSCYIVLFQMLVRGWWSVSNVIDFPNV